MVKIYMELTTRKTGLTQIGFYKPGNSFIPNSSVIQIPFTLTDEELAPSFDYGKALKLANQTLQSLNMGYYKTITVDFVEVQNEKV